MLVNTAEWKDDPFQVHIVNVHQPPCGDLRHPHPTCHIVVVIRDSETLLFFSTVIVIVIVILG